MALLNRTPPRTREVVIRVIADAILLNAAVLLAVIGRYIYAVSIESQHAGADPVLLFQAFMSAYRNSFLLLTLISLITFYLSGFYTRGRAYRSRYKVLIVFQAVGLSYLLFTAISYFVGGDLGLPRGSVVIAWGLSTAFLVGARLWTSFWAGIAGREQQPAQRVQAELAEGKTAPLVLVIGGAGYIGSALLPKLLDKGYQVRLLDMMLYGEGPIRKVMRHPNLEVMEGDFRQVDKVTAAMRDVDVVVHLGAIVGDPACALDQELTVEVNLMATRMVAEVAKGFGVSRFVFASTCSVYGASDETLDEMSALNPVSLYAQSKIASEAVLMGLADECFSPIILRFATIYGLSGRTRFDLVVNLLTAKAIADGSITVTDGQQWRPFVHVDDAALAVLKAVEAPLSLVHKQVFNVGSNEQNYRIREVGEIIKRLVPTSELLDLGTSGDPRNYRVDFGKIRKVLDFRPTWTIEDGVRQVIDAFESGVVRDYRDPHYSNVKYLAEESLVSRLVRHENGWAYSLIKDACAAREAAVKTRVPRKGIPVEKVHSTESVA